MKKKSLILASLPLLIGSGLVGCSKERKNPTKDYDVVGQTHINLTDELFNKVMKENTSSDFDPTYCDFQRDGVELMQTQKHTGTGDGFTNYVDGDTTQFNSMNGSYTVKVRYLSVDTPESTSEIEKWGKSASNFNKSKLKSAEYIIVQSATSAKTGEFGSADLDGYGRSLAYVWYTDKTSPKKEDFRNLNLELVYNGFSLNNSAQKNMTDEFFYAFYDAEYIAKYIKKWNIHSNDDDVNYWDKQAEELELKELYNKKNYTTSHPMDPDTDTSYSKYCDYKTRYTFKDVTVSAMIGNAFYIQKVYDKGTDAEKTYGLYVFTMRNYDCVKVGNVLNVTGVLEWYGGSYELAGVHYDPFTSEKHGWDMTYVKDGSGNNKTETITPKEVTCEQLQSGDYECNVVKLKNTDPNLDQSLYFNTAYSSYKGNVTSYSSGGLEEINTYNSVHPNYNSDNKIILFGKFGSDTGNISSYPNSESGKSDNMVRTVISSSLTIPNYQKPQSEIPMDYSIVDVPEDSFTLTDAITGTTLGLGENKEPTYGLIEDTFNQKKIKLNDCYKRSDSYLVMDNKHASSSFIYNVTPTKRDIKQVTIELAESYSDTSELHVEFSTSEITSYDSDSSDDGVKLNTLGNTSYVTVDCNTPNAKYFSISAKNGDEIKIKSINVLTCDSRADFATGNEIDSTTSRDKDDDVILSYRYFTGTRFPKNISDGDNNTYEERYMYYSKSQKQLVYDLEKGTKQYTSLSAEEKQQVSQRSYSRKRITDFYGVAQNYTSASKKNSMVTLNITTAEGIGHIESMDDFAGFDIQRSITDTDGTTKDVSVSSIKDFKVGDTIQLKTLATPTNDNLTFTYASSDETKVTVSNNGLLTAVSETSKDSKGRDIPITITVKSNKQTFKKVTVVVVSA